MSFFSFTSSRTKPAAPSLPGPQAVLDFWRDAGPERWFAKDEAFDEDFRSRFLPSHEAAARGELMRWMGVADSALALLLLLDQFPRNCFRGTPRMYATDAQALQLTQKALSAGYDTVVDKALRVFFYLPLMHDENLGSQFRCLALCAPLGGAPRRSSQEHYAVIEQFGRFPHRNAILGRTTTPEEQAFLDGGGFSG
ncbi:MAG: hypothetical protein GAK30_02618 [Paracidovorax wautersii]|uniref:DUF924 domain-containing protein n=1 Tax=Paracidovorax wautersii TaxID=1177982 RepID=A0A7V8JPM0_9BURK|nr:MAG: hypothetical protein GAK30_02618 [Paracidovorax wautersii]